MSTSTFPAAASHLASEIDLLFLVTLLMTGAVTIVIFVLMIVFALRYRRGSAASRVRAPPVVRQRMQRRMEIAWIAIPALLFVALFGWASALYFDRSVPPPDAMEISVIAKQWMWRVEHASGAREIDILHVPVGVPVKLIMTSQDVIHSFFLPAFRVKQDVLPGRYTALWFTADKVGEFHLLCAEYCGTDHASMFGHVVVLDGTGYAQWLAANGSPVTMASRGAALYRRLGCSGCHGSNAPTRAPPLDSLYGTQVALASGRTVVADEVYLRDSIVLPSRDVVAGYASVMPTYNGQISESEILEIIAYLKSLGRQGAAQ